MRISLKYIAYNSFLYRAILNLFYYFASGFESSRSRRAFAAFGAYIRSVIGNSESAILFKRAYRICSMKLSRLLFLSASLYVLFCVLGVIFKLRRPALGDAFAVLAMLAASLCDRKYKGWVGRLAADSVFLKFFRKRIGAG